MTESRSARAFTALMYSQLAGQAGLSSGAGCGKPAQHGCTNCTAEPSEAALRSAAQAAYRSVGSGAKRTRRAARWAGGQGGGGPSDAWLGCGSFLGNLGRCAAQICGQKKYTEFVTARGHIWT
eukprot:1466676-Pleurochrysis_carterae.AAC.1